MNIIITVDEKNLKNIDTIAKSLKRLGVDVEDVLKITGIITGSVDRKYKDFSNLKIEGVKSIELSKKLKAI